MGQHLDNAVAKTLQKRDDRAAANAQAILADALDENRRLHVELAKYQNWYAEAKKHLSLNVSRVRYLLTVMKQIARLNRQINGRARDWHLGAMAVKWAVSAVTGVKHVQATALGDGEELMQEAADAADGEA
jgi:hypothetical protein